MSWNSLCIAFHLIANLNDIEGTCKLEIELVTTTKIVQNRLIKNTHIKQYIRYTIILDRIASFDLLHFLKGVLSVCVFFLIDLISLFSIRQKYCKNMKRCVPFLDWFSH